ncbi:4-(cytidine 5'-diphospho)-2-C-methyl-D-erythritol kinase [Polluticaenibacter yanchengensis]|uniref:4-diphosphocytidyl-2-C-methyl-D-erythritol kinase n=1 Tax=Polluticaenibacter yanchengensis TaxID=3014562 RepID=A0ABT4UFY7_9BACT|nr:4-(cytidine 5'-diphospho)-2-C-methyl-D-erythritol kinase [Chitinophagaceae bacterium LY-5]
MIDFPHCKINLGLNITEKRKDGFHNLETIFVPVPVRDVLEIVVQQDYHTDIPVIFTSSGISIPGTTENNLCVKAWHLLKQDYPDKIKPVAIHLIKHIPIGAGLGGGSSNGAFALKILNKLFFLNLSRQQLIHYALVLGSDCPFFIYDTPCYATGRGEHLTPLNLNLAHYHLLIVNPGIHINTGLAFKAITPKPGPGNLFKVPELPLSRWQQVLVNDFQQPVSAEYPVIAALIAELQSAGAGYAAMSGTGSTVFGIFENKQSLEETRAKIQQANPAFYTRAVALQ